MPLFIRSRVKVYGLMYGEHRFPSIPASRPSFLMFYASHEMFCQKPAISDTNQIEYMILVPFRPSQCTGIPPWHHSKIMRWSKCSRRASVIGSSRKRPIQIFGRSQTPISFWIMLEWQHFQGQTSSLHCKGYFASVSKIFGHLFDLFRPAKSKIRFYDTKTAIFQQTPFQMDQFNNQT